MSSWLGWTGFTHKIRVAQAFSTFMHEKTTRADFADIESSRYLDMKEKAEKFLFGNWKGFSYVLDLSVELIGKTVTLIGVAVVVASLNPIITVVFAALVLLSSYVEAHIQAKQADMQLSLTLYERRLTYYGQVMEDSSYGKETRLYNLGDWLIGRERKYADYGYETYKASNTLGIRSGVFSSFTGLIQQAIAYAYLVSQFTAGLISIGDFTMYVGAVMAFSGAMRSFMQNIVGVRAYRKYWDAVEEYLGIPASMRDNARKPVPEGSHVIEFCDVSFSYPGQEGYALRNISIVLHSGQRASIVGENGAGKTTFVKLLCRIYDPTEGCILLDGIDIRDIDYDQYMSLFSTVFQDYKLFALSLKDNVALAESDSAKDHDVEMALHQAGFGEKLDSLSEGLQTLVYRNYDDEGFEPSGGEGQKIALARALYRGAPIVILDEPAAALDPRAEYEMYQGFNKLIGNRTAVYISHRLSSTQFCDVVAVFHNGEIIEYGTHYDLLTLGGMYAALWNMQAQYYKD